MSTEERPRRSAEEIVRKLTKAQARFMRLAVVPADGLLDTTSLSRVELTQIDAWGLFRDDGEVWCPSTLGHKVVAALLAEPRP